MSKIFFHHPIASTRVRPSIPARKVGCKPSSTNNKLILLVSLESTLQAGIAYNLGRLGYRVLRADNESLALPVIREQKPGIIILDINGRQDIDSSTLLQESGENAFLLLVSQQDIEIESDRIEVLEKPFQVRALIQKITTLSQRLVTA